MSGREDPFWSLDPDVDFLNHGSFGATPRAVQAAQTRWRARLEREPVRFFQRELEPALDAARDRLSELLGARHHDLAFVPNATSAVNAVLRSYELEPGDEIIVSNHVYHACANAARYVAHRSGARVVTARIPFPIDSPQQAEEAYAEALSDRTRLAVVEHVTSPTALVLPVARITSMLTDRGIDVLVDGAHAPGMVPVDVDAVGATFYAGNCHKWLCAPKGAGFLHVRADRRDDVVPAVVSHGFDARHDSRSRFHLLFDWTGTDDPSAYLSVPTAIEAVDSLHPDGLSGLMEANHRLALAARRVLSDRLEVAPPAPDSMIGSMASIPLPDATEPPLGHGRDPLQDRLLFEHGIEVPLELWPAWPRRNVRISAQAYNHIDQYRRLAGALATLLGDGMADRRTVSPTR